MNISTSPTTTTPSSSTPVPPGQPAELDARTTPSAEEEYVDAPVPVPAEPDAEAELARHEAIIADSLTSAFVQAGNALGIIQNKKLYRNQFDNFDAYVQSRWGWQRAHAYRLIQAAQIVGRLSPIGDTLPMPTSESQLRPLSRLDADKQCLVWMKAVQDAGGRTPTADIVKAAVVGVFGPRKKSAATLTVYPAEGNPTGTFNGRVPTEDQTPEPATGAAVLPESLSPLQSDATMDANPLSPAEPASHPPDENATGGPVDRPLDPPANARIGSENSPNLGKTVHTRDGLPAAMNTVSAGKAAGPIQPEVVFVLADGREIYATDWVDGWIAAKWITGMLRDLERQSSLAVPVSAKRCARRQRLVITLAAGLNRSGDDPDPEYLRDAEDALGNVGNIVRTHSNYPRLIKMTTDSQELDS